jgi:hypothetical protein
MHKTLTTKNILVFCLLALPTIGVARQRAALGPIEVVQNSRTSITVLGQKFVVTAATRFAVNGKRVPTSRAIHAMAVNQNVYVEAEDSAKGAIATVVDVASEAYVPGSSTVYVLGAIDAYSETTGVITIGSLRIDSTSVAPEVLSKLRAGLSVEVSGIQPLPSGSVVGPIQLRIAGNWARKQSIGGSGFTELSLGGSGIQLQSIGGSGVLKQSIGGSGVQLQSIGGSGVLKQSIGGSGVQLQSIGGSGVLKQSIGGSGAQLQSIGGSGVFRLNSIGTALR